MKKRGRKSAAEISTPASVPDVADISRKAAPGCLDEPAAALWDKIIRMFPQTHVNAADLVLLREFCHVSETLLPSVNAEFEKFPSDGPLRTRAMLVKEAQSLATKLRLVMSSRTRGDLATVRDATKHMMKPPWLRKGDPWPE